MSSPTGDDPTDHLKYAPPWARRQSPQPDEATSPAEPQHEAPDTVPDMPEPAVHPRDLDLPGAQPPDIADAPETAPPTGEQPLTWLRKPAKPFEGDVAMRELRARLTLDPQHVPEPPEPPRTRSMLRLVLRVLGVTAFAACTAYVVVLLGFPEEKISITEKREPLPMFTSPKADRAPIPQSARTEPARLILIENRRAAVNEPVPLGVNVSGAFGQGTLVLSGLASGTRLSAGEPLGPESWRVPFGDLARAVVVPPRDFTGTMELAVELRAIDGMAADKSRIRIVWTSNGAGLPAPAQPATAREPAAHPTAPAPPAAPSPAASPAAAPPSRPDAGTLDPEEVAALVKRGRDFLANGDLAAARLILRRAADAGDAQAALLLGSTFDPATFDQLKVVGSAPDPAEARRWYQRAVELGSAEAVRRLEPLARGTQ